MSEVAYSIEMKNEISKADIRKLQHSGTITDKTKFKCLDPKCEIPLSCACWEEGQYQREPYFYPTRKKESPHVFNCKFVSEKEIKEAVQSEVEQVYKALQIRTEIVLGSPASYSKSKEKTSNNATSETDTSETRAKTKRVTTELQHKEQSTWYRNLQSFVSMYHDTKINNYSPIKLNLAFEERENYNVKQIKGTKISSNFNEFFYQISARNVPLNTLKVFYGKAKIIELDDKGFCKVVFTDKPSIYLPFNINQVPRNQFIKSMAGKGNDKAKLKEIMVYFEGAMSFVRVHKEGRTTFDRFITIPLTKEFYRSLYFEKI